MKTIKLRAWNKEAKKYFEPAPRFNAMTISITLNGEIIGHPNVGEVTSRYELEQFTGLFDKNDNPIYEGDLVKYETGDPERPFVEEVVEFNEGAFYPVCMQSSDLFETVGNIHENPELLKL